MSAPRLSVAMAVHNGMPFLEESVRSILSQSFRDFELVIGDDGSSDGSEDLLRELAKQDSRIRLLKRGRKSGLAASANWVVGETRSPLIAIAHADDLSRPERLARQAEVFATCNDAVLVGTLCDGIDADGRVVRPADFWRLSNKSPFAPFGHSSIMFRRDAFQAVGGYRPCAEYWEDLDLYFRLAKVGRILVVPEVLTSIRHSSASTRLRDDEASVENAVDLMYSAAALYWRSGEHDQLLSGPADPARKLHPRTFVARGSTRLWSGNRVRVLKRVLRRGRLSLNLPTVRALVWAAWGELSPRTLRLFIRSLLQLLNLQAAPKLKGGVVEWRPTRLDMPSVNRRPAPSRP